MYQSNHNPPLVVFSHLRWNFVYQRPQHLLSRLAQYRQVIFIEEPVTDKDAKAHWEISAHRPNVLVCKPHLPVEAEGFDDAHASLLKKLVVDLMNELEVDDYLLWLYTPMALPLARALPGEPVAVLYDCMDDLASFRFAPPSLLARETALMRWADVVLTGGPSLYRARQGKHPNLHCLPSSVDVAHFASASQVPEAQDQASLPHPRLGWFGVIDERLDIELLQAVASARPEWQFVMLGPVAKIDPADLPALPNIHYLGQRDYADLPSYLAGWDVCIQPFALNEATRFISPTKTLEYMAAGLPIVSTRVTDVAQPYGHIVYIADTPEEFVLACEEALGESESKRQERMQNGAEVLARTSWDSTAEQVDSLLREAAARKLSIVGYPSQHATA
jgi:UDP-galactopyranose mutase